MTDKETYSETDSYSSIARKKPFVASLESEDNGPLMEFMGDIIELSLLNRFTRGLYIL